jgi:hypothetical protein
MPVVDHTSADVTSSPSGASRLSEDQIAIIGRSHIVSLKQAYDARIKTKSELRYVFRNTAPFEPIPPNTVLSDALKSSFGPVIEESNAVCLVINGTQHHFLSLLRQRPPIDVVTSYDPDLPLVEGAQLVPERAVVESYEKTLEALRLIGVFARQLNPVAKIFVMAGPSPIEDNTVIARKIDRLFAKRLEAAGISLTAAVISEPLVRWKFWRILDGVYERISREFGGTFLHVPVHTCEGRYLKSEATGDDSSHGNAWYGEQRLRQIEEAIK